MALTLGRNTPPRPGLDTAEDWRRGIEGDTQKILLASLCALRVCREEFGGLDRGDGFKIPDSDEFRQPGIMPPDEPRS